MKSRDRWNERSMMLETCCLVCEEWHPKFSFYPKLALCPYRFQVKHLRRGIRWAIFPVTGGFFDEMG